MTEAEDKELSAMKTVLDALQSLDSEARTRVLQYVFDRLGISLPVGSISASQSGPTGTLQSIGTSPQPISTSLIGKDIRTLKQEKQPKSANQMAALVAYYLSEVAPLGERKEAIGTADITRYFKQAGYPLPERPDATLANARSAGYLDPVGGGLHKLNPVGYNLVVHGLPVESRKQGVKKAKKTAVRRKK